MPLHTTLKLESNDEYPGCQLYNDNPSSSQYDVQWRSFQSLTKRHFEWSSTSLGLPRKLGLQFEIPSTCTYFMVLCGEISFSWKSFCWKSFLCIWRACYVMDIPLKNRMDPMPTIQEREGPYTYLYGYLLSPFHSLAHRCRICHA